MLAPPFGTTAWSRVITSVIVLRSFVLNHSSPRVGMIGRRVLAEEKNLEMRFGIERGEHPLERLNRRAATSGPRVSCRRNRRGARRRHRSCRRASSRTCERGNTTNSPCSFTPVRYCRRSMLGMGTGGATSSVGQRLFLAEQRVKCVLERAGLLQHEQQLALAVG